MKRAAKSTVVLGAACLAFCLPIGTANATVAARQHSVAYKLAVVDGEVSPDSATVREYAVPLRSLDAKCKDNKRSIGDLTVKAQEILRDDTGEELSLLEILNDVDESIPDGIGPQPCTDVFTAFVVLTEG